MSVEELREVNGVFFFMRSRLRLMDVLNMKCLVGFRMGCCCDSGGVHISVNSCKYLLKTLKQEVRLEVFHYTV